jgi:hypothetical protein
MSFEQTFSKSSKSAISDFKATAQVMISNGSNFSIQCLDISALADDSTIYPDNLDLSIWTKNLLNNETKSKPLPAKALEEMARKGLSPKKQINEIILVSITPSKTHIHVGMWIPENMLESLDPKDFISSVLECYSYANMSIIDNKVFVDIVHPEPLKERDNVLRCFFAELKKRKIYVEEEDDDQMSFTLDD